MSNGKASEFQRRQYYPISWLKGVGNFGLKQLFRSEARKTKEKNFAQINHDLRIKQKVLSPSSSTGFLTLLKNNRLGISPKIY